MLVHRHAEKSLVALTQKLPVPASVIINTLQRAPEPTKKLAVTLSLGQSHGVPFQGSNGDTLVLIIADGMTITAYLRRSVQSFDPATLRVDHVITWAEYAEGVTQ
jgi:hypothetical protein